MKITAANIVGREVGPDKQRIDERWLMAYSAALGETRFPHPLFPVCYEWPATRLLRERAGLAPLDPRLVHAQHDLTIHRAPSSEVLRISGKVVAVTQRRPGALLAFRFAAHDARDVPVTTTDFSVLYRDVKLADADRALEKLDDPPPCRGPLPKVGEIEIAATAAHVYTECARIWNPIHTDIAYARAAGLPGTILHGTATLALSVSRVLAALGVAPGAVRRVRCRFTGMVLMPSVLTVFASAQGATVAFETRDARGEAVIERGWIIG